MTLADLDQIAITRRKSGDITVTLTRAERLELARQLLKAGEHRDRIRKLTGLNVYREFNLATGTPKKAACGTDSGYYRHRRILREEACDDCKAAHAAAERNGGPAARYCECGTIIRSAADRCYACRNGAKRCICGQVIRAKNQDQCHDCRTGLLLNEDDGRILVGWRKDGMIKRPLFRQSGNHRGTSC